MQSTQSGTGPDSSARPLMQRRRGPPAPLRLDTPTRIPHISPGTGESSASASNHSATTSALSSATSELDEVPSTRPRSLRNMKKLSLTLSPAQSSTSSLGSVPPSEASSNATKEQLNPRRRLSVVSLPAVSTTATLLHRKEEEGSPTIPYQDGPLQVLPGVWLGSEDNARDWKGLLERGIRSILNVAKEVVSPFDSAASQPQRPFASTPNLQSVKKASKSTYYPAHIASGRPGMHYLKLQWSHGQSDLVQEGFPSAMAFVDSALDRGEGVLIHCQCGISRSATLVIALVMRASALSLPSVPPEIWDLKGYQAAYAYVKEKSRWAGPNMSLIYQLLEYERTLKGGNSSPTPSDRSSVIAEEEEEWGRRRRLLDDAEPCPADDEDERESSAVMREAQALDKAMEERIVARKSSVSSISSITSATGMGMGPAWRSKYDPRKRATSVASNRTSIMSENLVEEDEEQALLGVGGGFDDSASERLRRSSTDGEDSALSSTSQEEPDNHGPPAPCLVLPPKPQARRPARPLSMIRVHPSPPPSAPATKTSFGVSQDPPASKSSAGRRSSSTGKSKRRSQVVSVLPTVPSSPNNAPPAAPPISQRIRRDSRKPAPPPLHLRSTSQHPPQTKIAFPSSSSSSSKPSSINQTLPTPSQTLFVFPPSPTTRTRTPSTMTLNNLVPFPKSATPRVSTFRSSQGRTRSFIGIGTSPAPTTACSRVDVRGWFGIDR